MSNYRYYVVGDCDMWGIQYPPAERAHCTSRSPDAHESDLTWRTEEVRHVGSDTIAPRFGASQLRGLTKKTKDGPQARQLLALAAIYDGATRTEAAMIGGVGLQIIRDWVLHFNEGALRC